MTIAPAGVRVVAAVLGCYHTGRLEAERSVECECAIEVGNGEGYYINARFHLLRAQDRLFHSGSVFKAEDLDGFVALH
jgi:hypothetical protein